MRLVENDYAIVRKFAGRSSFATFLSVVVQRMFLDFRIQAWGKWHSSAEAKRLGDTAVELERLLVRDGRTIDEAFAIISAEDPSLTSANLAALAERLPSRPPSRRLVDLEEAATVPA